MNTEKTLPLGLGLLGKLGYGMMNSPEEAYSRIWRQEYREGVGAPVFPLTLKLRGEL